MSASLVVKVNYKRKEEEYKLPKNATLTDLKTAFHQKHKGLYPSRQSYKFENESGKEVRLSDDSKPLVDYSGDISSKVLIFKDLGPQIGYRTVFLWEYFGPLVIVPFFAMRPSFIYGSGHTFTKLDDKALICVIFWAAHFLKRELETIFVHRFSRPTMPLLNLFKNSIYYWSFAFFVAYPLCHPLYTPPVSDFQFYLGAILFILFELGNLKCHLILKNLRPAEGSQQRPIPKGFLFKFVSCPNYTTEVASWIAFTIMSQVFFSGLFTLVGFLQMFEWAVKKHKGYLKTYGDEYKKLRRKVMVPFAL